MNDIQGVGRVFLMLNYTEKHKEHPPEVWSVPPVTPCIHVMR